MCLPYVKQHKIRRHYPYHGNRFSVQHFMCTIKIRTDKIRRISNTYKRKHSLNRQLTKHDLSLVRLLSLDPLDCMSGDPYRVLSKLVLLHQGFLRYTYILCVALLLGCVSFYAYFLSDGICPYGFCLRRKYCLLFTLTFQNHLLSGLETILLKIFFFRK